MTPSGKDGRCVALIFPPSCIGCLEILETSTPVQAYNGIDLPPTPSSPSMESNTPNTQPYMKPSSHCNKQQTLFPARSPLSVSWSFEALTGDHRDGGWLQGHGTNHGLCPVARYRISVVAHACANYKGVNSCCKMQFMLHKHILVKPIHPQDLADIPAPMIVLFDNIYTFFTAIGFPPGGSAIILTGLKIFED